MRPDWSEAKKRKRERGYYGIRGGDEEGGVRRRREERGRRRLILELAYLVMTHVGQVLKIAMALIVNGCMDQRVTPHSSKAVTKK